MKTLAIIPARGGSKGIPKKNISLLGNKPLIAWTLEAALIAEAVDRVIVTTDNPEIAKIAKDYGAEVPFQRPASLAQDDTPGIKPILHATHWLIDHEDYLPDFVVCLQPTSPFRTGKDIDRAMDLARLKNADSVVSITPLVHNPNWMQIMDGDGRLKDFIPGGTSVGSRQEMEQVYELNGAIYLIRTVTLFEEETFFVKETFGFVMPRERSIDIDTPWDLYLADLIAKDEKWES